MEPRSWVGFRGLVGGSRIARSRKEESTFLGIFGQVLNDLCCVIIIHLCVALLGMISTVKLLYKLCFRLWK